MYSWSLLKKKEKVTLGITELKSLRDLIEKINCYLDVELR